MALTMPVAITCQSLSKSFSSRPLFRDISFTIDERERLGLIGPNGSGKSTLMKIMAGLVEPDGGSIATRRLLQVAYLPQENLFPAGSTVREVVAQALISSPIDDDTQRARVEIVLSKMGFSDLDCPVDKLSGGWRKRLGLAEQVVKEPDLLLLDEPTNHLDLEGVLFLEDFLKSAPFAFVVVSHDRSFLENVTNRTIEFNPLYRDGFLSVKGPYSTFLQAREEYVAAQSHEEQALASKARREIAWLQRGARARQTKSVGRIREAGKLLDELQEVKSRNRLATASDIDFNASGRKTKELIVCKGIEKSYGDKTLFSKLDLTLGPGQKLGLLGTNGSGKTTLLKILAGKLEPDNGTIKRAENLKVVWFDQNRDQLNKEITLRQALCASGESVNYRGRSIHIASWARRFLFQTDQLNMPVSYLSGGEQARILIARLMLEPADILILDEPTNDLDIPSLEVLEDSLEDFPGVLVLVTHDRFMLDNISTQLLALDGRGGCKFFADYEQWEKNGRLEKSANTTEKSAKRVVEMSKPSKPLSTGEKKELLQIGEKIESAEAKVHEIKRCLDDPKIAAHHTELQQVMDQLHQARADVDKLYARWEDLETRKLEQEG